MCCEDVRASKTPSKQYLPRYCLTKYDGVDFASNCGIITLTKSGLYRNSATVLPEPGFSSASPCSSASASGLAPVSLRSSPEGSASTGFLGSAVELSASASVKWFGDGGR